MLKVREDNCLCKILRNIFIRSLRSRAGERLQPTNCNLLNSYYNLPLCNQKRQFSLYLLISISLQFKF